MGLESEEDPAENDSTISRNGVRWTCIQQTSWHNEESIGCSWWNAWSAPKDMEPMDQWWIHTYIHTYIYWNYRPTNDLHILFAACRCYNNILNRRKLALSEAKLLTAKISARRSIQNSAKGVTAKSPHGDQTKPNYVTSFWKPDNGKYWSTDLQICWRDHGIGTERTWAVSNSTWGMLPSGDTARPTSESGLKSQLHTLYYL